VVAAVDLARGPGATVPAYIHNVTFDAEQPRTLGRFWSHVTGYDVVDERDDFVRLRAPDGRGVPDMLFIGVDDPTPGKNRMHVDLAARDPEAEIDRLVRLGASLVDEPGAGMPRWREGNGIRWVVLRDPEGNEFCLGADPGADDSSGTVALQPHAG
jgi:catechol 2,3-dioxygenase-like lactoylglutathione lyase family enzyme